MVRALRVLSVLAAVVAIGLVARHWLAPRSAPEPLFTVADNRSAVSRILGERALPEDERRGGFRLEPIDEATAAALFNQLANQSNRFDPHCFFRYRPHVERAVDYPEHPDGGWVLRTNELGLRNDDPVDPSADLRILFTGDSHTDGICNNAEGFPALLAERLGPGVQALNSGKSGYSFYNYLGVLETFRELEPDLFVVCVYGGNDFAEILLPHHYHQRLPWPDPEFVGAELLREVRELLSPGVLPQGLMQATLFQENPELERVCAEAVAMVVDALGAACAERSLPWLVVYVPSVLEVQRELYGPELDQAVERLGLDERGLGLPTRLAEHLFERLEARGVRTLDLRPTFRAHGEPLYWRADHHLDLEANRIVADELAALLESL